MIKLIKTATKVFETVEELINSDEFKYMHINKDLNIKGFIRAYIIPKNICTVLGRDYDIAILHEIDNVNYIYMLDKIDIFDLGNISYVGVCGMEVFKINQNITVENLHSLSEHYLIAQTKDF